MTATDASIIKLVQELLESMDQAEGVEVTLDSTLHGEDGLGLDSLDTAELSATLEDEFGSDPFAAGLMPETIAEIVAFYASEESVTA
jgi:acyl carrier protein